MALVLQKAPIHQRTFAKIGFYNQNLILWWKHIKKEKLSGGTWFYYSHMMVSAFPRAQR